MGDRLEQDPSTLLVADVDQALDDLDRMPVDEYLELVWATERRLSARAKVDRGSEAPRRLRSLPRVVR